MKLEINSWTHHLNHIVYSFFYFCKKHNTEINISCNKNIINSGAILYIDNKTFFFDYSDDTKFMDISENFTFYFKRSLLEKDKINNVYSLNLNIPLSYKSLQLLPKLNTNLLLDKSSREEIIRALDIFSLVTKISHKVLDIRRYPNKITDSGGKVIFHTRLWNPDNHPDSDEKERRRLQNEFRISACRVIKKYYKTASTGLVSSDLSIKIAPDLLLNKTHSNKNNYLNYLNHYDIGISDDGLKDTPGWKIGEYALYGKAIITTPITVSLDNFTENKNYLALSDRNSYKEIPEKIEMLLKNKHYLEIGKNNLDWSHEYIHPENYIERILHITQA